mgnify:FL=1|jgi:hypothetical protein|tara:strand:- start:21 stop:287 length:267 start_codon:yes stop_codon:yes gene_type:complete
MAQIKTKGIANEVISGQTALAVAPADTDEFLVSDGGSKPTEQECTDGLLTLQTSYDDSITKQITNKASGNAKLKALGLTDDEIEAITK